MCLSLSMSLRIFVNPGPVDYRNDILQLISCLSAHIIVGELKILEITNPKSENIL